MWPVATDGVAWSVSRSVTAVSPAKAAEMIVVRDVDSGGPKEPCIR